MLSAFAIFLLFLVVKIFFMINEQENRINELCERLSNIERDALKITFDKRNEKR